MTKPYQPETDAEYQCNIYYISVILFQVKNKKHFYNVEKWVNC